MCGFVGFYKNEAINDYDTEKLEIMADVIKHRGPDSSGIFVTKNLAFAFRRLSFIDLENGTQPFTWNGGKLTGIFNGEIYNYIELGEELKKDGYEFKTRAEIEIILSLYDKYGVDFVKHLRGMFCILIWDRDNNRLVACRDPFGIKPFYYIDHEDGLYFSSESKAFMYHESTYRNEIDKTSLQNYLTFQFVPEPNTILKHIKVVPAGNILIKDFKEKPVIKEYFEIKFKPVPMPKDERIKEIRRVLENSVEVHMRSDVPIATFLSGGIDSTIVTYLASKIDPKIKSYTVGFEVEGYSEISQAKETSERLGIDNIQLNVSAKDYMDELPKIIWHLDGPVADPSAIPIYFISRECAKSYKGVLSGEGSDEIFGGYNIYGEVIPLKVFNNVPVPVKNALSSFANILPDGVKGKSFIKRGCVPLERRYVGNAFIFNEEEKSKILRTYDKNKPYYKTIANLYDYVKNENRLIKMQYIDMQTWLKGDILVKSDRMTMAQSLELRVPFLDVEVFKVASKLTESDKVNSKNTKILLREAFKDVIYEDAVERKKLGYPVPIRVWLKNEMYDWAKKIIKESGTDRYIVKSEVLKLLDLHRGNKGDYSRKIWTVLVFMLWHKIFIEDYSKAEYDSYEEIAIDKV
ncbi:MAG: asparagine synthase (glutamine-hydrolyzing) [Oscillospiraceae bacterium]|nr:asparagine synthase (glutamine-hydrolyzing) [Oscillospiraceae bacterium]